MVSRLIGGVLIFGPRLIGATENRPIFGPETNRGPAAVWARKSRFLWGFPRIGVVFPLGTRRHPGRRWSGEGGELVPPTGMVGGFWCPRLTRLEGRSRPDLCQDRTDLRVELGATERGVGRYCARLWSGAGGRSVRLMGSGRGRCCAGSRGVLSQVGVCSGVGSGRFGLDRGRIVRPIRFGFWSGLRQELCWLW